MYKYKISEMFVSIQGEGTFAGVPAIFIRFAGCNKACIFCDEKKKESTEMTDEEIYKYLEGHPVPETVVLTGGEPTLQIDERLLAVIKQAGKTIHIETNGTNPELINDMKEYLGVVTISPKEIKEGKRFMVYAGNLMDGLRVVEFKFLFPFFKNDELTGFIKSLMQVGSAFPNGNLVVSLQPIWTGEVFIDRKSFEDACWYLDLLKKDIYKENAAKIPFPKISIQLHKFFNLR